MVRLGTAAVKFNNLKMLSLLQVFYRRSFDIVASVIEAGAVAQLIKYFVHAPVDFPVQVGKMGAAVVVAGIRQIKDFMCRYDPVKTVPVAVLHFFHTE